MSDKVESGDQQTVAVSHGDICPECGCIGLCIGSGPGGSAFECFGQGCDERWLG